MQEHSALTERFPPFPCWDFSCALYSIEAVKDACLRLQNAHACNTNVILFSCYLAVTGRGCLELDELRAVLDAIKPWHQNITVRLRSMRNSLAGFGLPRWCKMIRADILDHELAAEYAEQRQLIRAVPRIANSQLNAMKMASDAVVSLTNYCVYLEIKVDLPVEAALHQVLSHVFPNMNSRKLQLLFKSVPLPSIREFGGEA